MFSEVPIQNSTLLSLNAIWAPLRFRRLRFPTSLFKPLPRLLGRTHATSIVPQRNQSHPPLYFLLPHEIKYHTLSLIFGTFPTQTLRKRRGESWPRKPSGIKPEIALLERPFCTRFPGHWQGYEASSAFSSIFIPN